jgi:hypothetical protein
MSPKSSWPALDHAAMAPTIEHLHRLSQIGGKYTVDEPFELNWGNVPLTVTPRGFATPTLYAAAVPFAVEYDLLDHAVLIAAGTGRTRVALEPGSVAGFLERFTEAAGTLGVAPLRNLSQPEIAGAPPLDEDTEHRPYDRASAELIVLAFGRAAAALTAYQAPFRGHRHRAGLMWGGFDLSAQRFNGRSARPPAGHPAFLQNGMTGEVVSVGFSLGSAQSPAAGFYGYVSPAPEAMADADFGVPGATWNADAGLAVLPWEAVRRAADPAAEVVRFGDGVYAVAGWPAELIGPRVSGRHAATRPLFDAA